jgi:hypothetical protein
MKGVIHKIKVQRKKLLGTLDRSINSTIIDKQSIPPDIDPNMRHISKPTYSSYNHKAL